MNAPLHDDEVASFERDGFVVLRAGFDRAVAAAGRDYMWQVLGVSPDDPAGWPQPFVHIQQVFADGPFRAVMNPRLAGAFDQLLGAQHWRFRESYGWWPVLFPGYLTRKPRADLGWHVDGMRNARRLTSPEQGLVTLFLFSDIGPGDGGTALRVGSHSAVARLLADAGPDGFAAGEMARHIPPLRADDNVAELTGEAGDVALLHPFLVHAVNANHGTRVRFACNPHVARRAPMRLDVPLSSQSPVERAITAAVRAS